jgi:hypothetical protein
MIAGSPNNAKKPKVNRWRVTKVMVLNGASKVTMTLGANKMAAINTTPIASVGPRYRPAVQRTATMAVSAIK